MKVYIGLSKPTGKIEPFAWLIQKVEDQPYDHAYVRFQEPTGQWMIFQASGTAVNMFSVPNWIAKNESLKEYEIDITDVQNSALWAFVLKSLGIPYSLIEDFGILLMKIFKLKNNPYNKGMSAEFCSKLAATVCGLLGLTMPADLSNIDPTLLDQILTALKLPFVLNPVLTGI